MEKDNFSIDPKLEELSEKWQKNPKSRAFAPLADAYRKSGMLEEALNVCLEGLKTHTEYISAHIVLGKIYLDKQMGPEAENEFQGVIEKDPDNLVTLNYLGDIYQKQHRYAEALEKFERAQKLDPFNEQIKHKRENLAKYGSQKPGIEPIASADTPEPGKIDMGAEEEKPAESDIAPPLQEAVAEEPEVTTEEQESVFELDSEEKAAEAAPEEDQVNVFEVEPVVSAAPSTPLEIEGEKVFDISDDIVGVEAAPDSTEANNEDDVTEEENKVELAEEEIKEAPEGSYEQPDVLVPEDQESSSDKIYDISEDEEVSDAEQEVQEEDQVNVFDISEEDEIEQAEETAAAPKEEEAEKVFDISEDIEPLDKITFSTTPFPQDENEFKAVQPEEAAEITEPAEVEAVVEEKEEEVISEVSETPEVEDTEEELAPQSPVGLQEIPHEEDLDFPPTSLAAKDIDLTPDKSEEHEVETVTMARIYAKQGMINKAKVICLKLLSLDPSNKEAKNLLMRLQVADEGQPLAEVEETPPVSSRDDEPVIDFRDDTSDDAPLDRAQTIFVGDKAEEEDDEPYRGTMMDADFGASSDDQPDEEDESVQEQKSDIKSWIDQIKNEEDKEE